MLVYVIEIPYKHFTPIVKTVERLNLFIVVFERCYILLIQFADKQDRVADGKVASLLEKLVYCHVTRAPHWSVTAVLEQIFVEEQAGSLVGKDNCYILKMSVETTEYIIRNKFQKWCHISYTSSILFLFSDIYHR